MSRAKDLTGMRFGRLTVIERVPSKSRHARWKCRCDCGNYTEVLSNNLKSGSKVSCGCAAHPGSRGIYDPDAPQGKCTIDRINVDGDYEPSNCRWVDAATQNANRRPFKYQNQWTKAKENADAAH